MEISQETSLIILLVFCVISLPIVFKSMQKKKKEEKKDEYYLFMFGFCVGIVLFLVLLVNAYTKFIK